MLITLSYKKFLQQTYDKNFEKKNNLTKKSKIKIKIQNLGKLKNQNFIWTSYLFGFPLGNDNFKSSKNVC